MPLHIIKVEYFHWLKFFPPHVLQFQIGFHYPYTVYTKWKTHKTKKWAHCLRCLFKWKDFLKCLRYPSPHGTGIITFKYNVTWKEQNHPISQKKSMYTQIPITHLLLVGAAIIKKNSGCLQVYMYKYKEAYCSKNQ